MSPLEVHRTFARYNAWMNEKLITSCATLDDATRKKQMSVPFGSLHGLWNHLMVADNLWLSRLQNTPVPFQFQGLDMEIYSDWDELVAARAALDERIICFAADFTLETLDSVLHWVSASNPTPRTSPMALVVAHMWNHQTHHRGQITALMELLGLDCGVTDLLALPELMPA